MSLLPIKTAFKNQEKTNFYIAPGQRSSKSRLAEERGNYNSANCRIQISLRECENKGYSAILKIQIVKPLRDIHLEGI